jgi:peptidylprolyl isomerase
MEMTVLKKYLFGLSLLLIAIMIIPLAGCSGSKVAQDGDLVRVHYTGTLEDGTTFDTSAGGDPLEFTLGGGNMIPGFENAVRGMKVGETKTITIPADEAYGQRSDDLILEFPREQLAGDIDPKVGDVLQLTQSNGTSILVPVIAVTDTTITVDANHELAGKDLTFKIELVDLIRN